jgi:protein-tyrosine-phosphatase
MRPHITMLSTSPTRLPRILFVCTGNAGRSQLAAAFFSRLAGPGITVLSAGVAPWPHLHPEAVKRLLAAGFSTDGLHPKSALTFAGTPLDYIVTIGDRARDELPRMAGTPVIIHWDIDDPADADGTGREEQAFRQTLARIEERLPVLLDTIRAASRQPPSA